MRPRVFPAEDYLGLVGTHEVVAASMRPRVFPAEDETIQVVRDEAANPASMRPRVFPAEDNTTLAFVSKVTPLQ